MRQFTLVGLAVAMALVLVACVGATSASATTICVSGTISAPCSDGHPGGPVTLTSTNFQMQIHGFSTVQCSSSTISGTAPATTATTVQVPVHLGFTGCTAFGFIAATVNVGSSCQTRTTLNVMAGAPAELTLPTNCTFDVSVPSINCTVTIHGPSAVKGVHIALGNATRSTHVTITASNATSITTHTGGGFGCPAPGPGTMTMAGTFVVTTPATKPGFTVIG